MLAGVCWALMMIKPQMAVLLVWPLLFSRLFGAVDALANAIFAATAPRGRVAERYPWALER